MFNPKLEKWRDMEHLGESRLSAWWGRCLLVVLLGSNQLGVATIPRYISMIFHVYPYPYPYPYLSIHDFPCISLSLSLSISIYP